jgi:16S rRNA processing protein RimM
LKDKHNQGPVQATPSSASGEPDSGSPLVSRKPKRPAANPRRRKPSPPRTLIETRGPEPATPLADVRLTVGRIGGTHGVRGEMKMRLLTDDPDNLTTVKTVYLGERDTPIGLENVRFTNDGAIIKLHGTDSPEAGALLSGLAVKIAGDDARPLEEGEYFLFQLIGLHAELEDGSPVGTVVDLIETGAHDVLVIGERPDTAEQLLVPNHPEFVLAINPDAGQIVIRPPEYGD